MFCEIKEVEFALDLYVIKTKIVSFSKKLFLVVSIASPGSFDNAAKRLRMRSLRPFPVSSLCCSFSFGVLSNCPGTEFVGMALKSSKRRKIHPRVFPFSKKKT